MPEAAETPPATRHGRGRPPKVASAVSPAESPVEAPQAALRLPEAEARPPAETPPAKRGRGRPRKVAPTVSPTQNPAESPSDAQQAALSAEEPQTKKTALRRKLSAEFLKAKREEPEPVLRMLGETDEAFCARAGRSKGELGKIFGRLGGRPRKQPHEKRGVTSWVSLLEPLSSGE